MTNKTGYIAAIARGHNSGVCLLKDGEVIFSIEEERLTRHKYDGGPYASMIKILEYTDKIDYLVIAHTQPLKDFSCGKVDFTGDDVYTGLARKLGLIDRKADIYNHPQVIDLSHMHHKLHTACAFYRSGFEEAVCVIVDGAGTFYPLSVNNEQVTGWETETIVDCAYPASLKTLYKHIGVRGPSPGLYDINMDSNVIGEDGTFELAVTDRAGITKVYEAVTQYCGFSAIEAGKTMGLFPYGKPNNNIPPLFDESGIFPISNRNLVVPTYPAAALINSYLFKELESKTDGDITYQDNRRDLAYACQHQTQDQVVRLIKKAVEMSGKNKVVISGGYGLNCVANYHYLKALEGTGIEIYCEPVSNDAGTAMGAAMLWYRSESNDAEIHPLRDTIYLGPKYNYTSSQINNAASSVGATVVDATDSDVVKLLVEKNIVALFQGSSENGPRALGNRSILFDPRFEDGKDFVNSVKRREYFRPFAGSILEEDAHEWFDLRGMPSSPTMMYAVNCQPGIEEKIPSIIHVDGTCRIQTVNEQQNPLYYRLIKEFKEQTGTPIVFNTSFNLGGDPLVETLDDAIDTLVRSEIEYLYLPEYKKLIKVSNIAN
jgi:carbamoyltransferase